MRAGWVGASTPLCIYASLHLHFAFPSNKSPSKNLGLCIFANLTLHAREARGIAQNQWFSLAAAKENHSESNRVSNLVTLYNAARTYFERSE